MGGNFNFPNFNNIFQNSGFNFNFGPDLNNLINNLMNQPNFAQQNSNNTQTFYEENNMSESSSVEVVENEAEEGQFNQEDMIHLKEEIINNFSKHKYNNYMKLKKKKIQETCAICLEQYKSDEIIVEFSCKNHFYHENCLYEWLQKSEICPLCKHNLMEDADS